MEFWHFSTSLEASAGTWLANTAPFGDASRRALRTRFARRSETARGLLRGAPSGGYPEVCYAALRERTPLGRNLAGCFRFYDTQVG